MLPLEINLPISAEVFEANHPPVSLSKSEIRQRLDNPEIANLLTGPSIIVVNDHHRSTPSGMILEVLADLYEQSAQVEYIVIASGTHEEPDDKQLSKITHLTEERFDCDLLIHDSLGQEVELKHVGTTTRGTEIKVHPVVLDYQNILCINSVEPHYFAGFTGGIKSIFPGLAARSSVEQNHSWALHEKSEPTNIVDNPLQLDLWEILTFLDKPIHGIQMVNFQDEIFELYTGQLRDAFLLAADKSMEIYSKYSSKQFDVVVSIIYSPLDRSLYQAQKGIENTRQILKPGGEMILVAACHEGIGNSAFYDTMIQYDNPDGVLQAITRENYRFGDHKAYKFASLARESKITLVSELTLSQANNVFADAMSFNDLEPYLSRLSGEKKSIAIVIDSGSLTVSYR